MRLTSKRNRPIQSLLKEFEERRRGKVVDSRYELQRRFKYLDWNIQKRILLSHLHSSTLDRKWAYTQLLNNWDDCFITHVKESWESFHEERCSWVIIRHFPKDYVLAIYTF